jgi:Uma2 family endonuclease
MTYTIDLRSITELNDDKFYQLCRQNPDVKLELNQRGELIVMSPTGGETGARNSEINAEFVIWNRQKKLGMVFDSSTCFKLANGAVRSPDVSWVSLAKWNQLKPEEKESFPPISADFVLELMSPGDGLKDTQNKMEDYISSGVRLAWLIDRQRKQVEIYRQGREKEVLNNPETLSGEGVLPDFVLDLGMVW